MILIIGGRYQGRLDFARERFGLADEEIYVCPEDCAEIDLTKRCVAYIDRFALHAVREGRAPEAFFKEHLYELRDAILITTDISCGVVPIDAVQRAWREGCGRMNNLLATHADEVWRLFCGLPQRLK